MLEFITDPLTALGIIGGILLITRLQLRTQNKVIAQIEARLRQIEGNTKEDTE